MKHEPFHRYDLVHGLTGYKPREFDLVYEVYICVSYGDIGLVSYSEIQKAIEDQALWRNPLRWVVVYTTQDKEEARFVRNQWKLGLSQGLGVSSIKRNVETLLSTWRSKRTKEKGRYASG